VNERGFIIVVSAVYAGYVDSGSVLYGLCALRDDIFALATWSTGERDRDSGGSGVSHFGDFVGYELCVGSDDSSGRYPGYGRMAVQ